MRKRTGERFLFKTISIFISLSFLFPALSWAFDASAYVNPAQQVMFAGRSVDIPPACGDVTSAFQGSDKLIVFVQDLHCNYEVQTNIARLLDFFKNQFALKLVAVEGASRPVNVSELAAFPLPRVKQEAADYLLRQGKITGPEFYAVTHPRAISLEGVEDAALYASNHASALKLLNTESQGLVLDLREAFGGARQHADNPALQALNQRKALYRANKISCLQYCRRLLADAQRLGLDPRRWPAIQTYLGPDVKDLARLSLEPVLLEISGLEQALRQRLYTTQLQADLDLWEHRLEIMEKLINLSATAKELAEFRGDPEQFRVPALAAFLNQAAPGSCPEDTADAEAIEPYLREAAAFYQVADARSRAFAGNILQRMQAQSASITVLVGGGYHAEEVLTELKAKGVSTLCVKPRLTRPDAANPYYAILKGRRTPLERLWAQDQRIFAPATIFAEGDNRAWNDAVLQRVTRQLLALGTLWSAWKSERLQDADAIKAYYSQHMRAQLDQEPGLLINNLKLTQDSLVAGFQRRIAAVLHAAATTLRLNNMAATEISLGEADVLLAQADPETVSAQLTTGEQAAGRLQGLRVFAQKARSSLSRISAGAAAMGESSMKGYYRARRFALWMIPGMLAFDGNVFLTSRLRMGAWLGPYEIPAYVLLAMLGAAGTAAFAINAFYYQKKFQTLFREVNYPTSPKGLIPLLQNYPRFTPPEGRHGLLDRVARLSLADAAARKMDLTQVPARARSIVHIEIADTVQRLPEFWQYTVAAHVRLHRQVLAGPRLFHGLAEAWATFWEPYAGAALWLKDARQRQIQEPAPARPGEQPAAGREGRISLGDWVTPFLAAAPRTVDLAHDPKLQAAVALLNKKILPAARKLPAADLQPAVWHFSRLEIRREPAGRVFSSSDRIAAELHTLPTTGIHLIGSQAVLESQEKYMLGLNLKHPPADVQDWAASVYQRHSLDPLGQNLLLTQEVLDMIGLFAAHDPELGNQLRAAYVLHEILCPLIGHAEARAVEKTLFPDLYKKYPEEGLLREVLRATILVGAVLREHERRGPEAAQRLFLDSDFGDYTGLAFDWVNTRLAGEFAADMILDERERCERALHLMQHYGYGLPEVESESLRQALRSVLRAARQLRPAADRKAVAQMSATINGLALLGIAWKQGQLPASFGRINSEQNMLALARDFQEAESLAATVLRHQRWPEKIQGRSSMATLARYILWRRAPYRKFNLDGKGCRLGADEQLRPELLLPEFITRRQRQAIGMLAHSEGMHLELYSPFFNEALGFHMTEEHSLSVHQNLVDLARALGASRLVLRNPMDPNTFFALVKYATPHDQPPIRLEYLPATLQLPAYEGAEDLAETAVELWPDLENPVYSTKKMGTLVKALRTSNDTAYLNLLRAFKNQIQNLPLNALLQVYNLLQQFDQPTANDLRGILLRVGSDVKTGKPGRLQALLKKLPILENRNLRQPADPKLVRAWKQCLEKVRKTAFEEYQNVEFFATQMSADSMDKISGTYQIFTQRGDRLLPEIVKLAKLQTKAEHPGLVQSLERQGMDLDRFAVLALGYYAKQEMMAETTYAAALVYFGSGLALENYFGLLGSAVRDLMDQCGLRTHEDLNPRACQTSAERLEPGRILVWGAYDHQVPVLATRLVAGSREVARAVERKMRQVPGEPAWTSLKLSEECCIPQAFPPGVALADEEQIAGWLQSAYVSDQLKAVRQLAAAMGNWTPDKQKYYALFLVRQLLQTPQAVAVAMWQALQQNLAHLEPGSTRDIIQGALEITKSLHMLPLNMEPGLPDDFQAFLQSDPEAGAWLNKKETVVQDISIEGPELRRAQQLLGGLQRLHPDKNLELVHSDFLLPEAVLYDRPQNHFAYFDAQGRLIAVYAAEDGKPAAGKYWPPLAEAYAGLGKGRTLPEGFEVVQAPYKNAAKAGGFKVEKAFFGGGTMAHIKICRNAQNLYPGEEAEVADRMGEELEEGGLLYTVREHGGAWPYVTLVKYCRQDGRLQPRAVQQIIRGDVRGFPLQPGKLSVAQAEALCLELDYRPHEADSDPHLLQRFGLARENLRRSFLPGAEQKDSSWPHWAFVSLLLLGSWQVLINLGKSQTWGPVAAPNGSILFATVACLPGAIWLPVAGLLALAAGSLLLYRHPEALNRLTNRLLHGLAANPVIKAIFLLAVMNTAAAAESADKMEKGILKLIQPEQASALQLALRILDQNRADLSLDDLRTELQGANADIKILESIGLLQKVKDTEKGRAVTGLRRVNREFWAWRKFLAVDPSLRTYILGQKLEYFTGRIQHYPPEIQGLMDLQVQFHMPLEQIQHMSDEQVRVMAVRVYRQALASHPGQVQGMPDQDNIFPYILVGMARHTAALLNGSNHTEVPEAPITSGTTERDELLNSKEKVAEAGSEIMPAEIMPAAATLPGGNTEERVQELSRRALTYETMRKLHGVLKAKEWAAFLADCLVILDAQDLGVDGKIEKIITLAKGQGMLNAALIQLHFPAASQWPMPLLRAYNNELPSQQPKPNPVISWENRSPIFIALKEHRQTEPNRTLAYQAQRLGYGGDTFFVKLIIQTQGQIEEIIADSRMRKVIDAYNEFRSTKEGEQVARRYLAAVLKSLAQSGSGQAGGLQVMRLPALQPGAEAVQLALNDCNDLVKAIKARQTVLLNRQGPAVLKRFTGFITLEELAEGLISHQGDFAGWAATYANEFRAAGYSPETGFGHAVQWLFQAAVIDVKNQKAAAVKTQMRAEDREPSDQGAKRAERAPGTPVKVEITSEAPGTALDAEELLAYRAVMQAFMQATIQLWVLVNRLHASLQSAETQARDQAKAAAGLGRQAQAADAKTTAAALAGLAAMDQARAAEDQLRLLLAQVPHFYREGAAAVLRLLAAAAQADALKHWLEAYENDLAVLDAVLQAHGMPEYAAAASRGSITLDDIQAMLARRPQWAAQVERERKRTLAVRESLIKHHGYTVLAAAELPTMPLLLARCEAVLAWDQAAKDIRASQPPAEVQYQSVAKTMQRHRYVVSEAAYDLDVSGLNPAEFEQLVKEWRLINSRFNQTMGLTLALDQQLMRWAQACCYQDRLIRGQVPADMIARYQLLHRVQGFAEPAAGQAQQELLQILQIDIPANYSAFQQQSRRENLRYQAVQSTVEKHRGDFTAAAPELAHIPDAHTYHERLLAADPAYRKRVEDLRLAADQALGAAKSIETELRDHQDVYQKFFGPIIMQPGIDWDALCILTAGYSPEHIRALNKPEDLLAATSKAMAPVGWEAFRNMVQRVRASRPGEGLWPLAEILNFLSEPQRNMFALMVLADMVPAADAAMVRLRLGLNEKIYGSMQRHARTHHIMTADERQVKLTPDAKAVLQIVLLPTIMSRKQELSYLLNWKRTEKQQEAGQDSVPGITDMLEYMSREEMENTVFKTRAQMAEALRLERADGRERLTLAERVIWEMLEGGSTKRLAEHHEIVRFVLGFIKLASTYESLGPIREADVDFPALRQELAVKKGPGKFLEPYGLDNKKLDACQDADILAALNKAWADPQLRARFPVGREVSEPFGQLAAALKSGKRIGPNATGLYNNALLIHAFPQGLAKHTLGLPASLIQDIMYAIAVPAIGRVATAQGEVEEGQQPQLRAVKFIAYYFYQQNSKLLARGYPADELAILQRALTAYTADELIAALSSTADRKATLLQIQQKTYEIYAPWNLTSEAAPLLESMYQLLKSLPEKDRDPWMHKRSSGYDAQKKLQAWNYDPRAAKLLLAAVGHAPASRELDRKPKQEQNDVIEEVLNCLKWMALQWRAQYSAKKIDIGGFLDFFPLAARTGDRSDLAKMLAVTPWFLGVGWLKQGLAPHAGPWLAAGPVSSGLAGLGALPVILTAGLLSAGLVYFIMRRTPRSARPQIEAAPKINLSLPGQAGIAAMLPISGVRQTAAEVRTQTPGLTGLTRMENLPGRIKANIPVLDSSSAWMRNLGLDRLRLAVESLVLMLPGAGYAAAAGSFDYQPLIRARFFKATPDLRDPALMDMIEVRTLNPADVGYWNYLRGLVVGYGRFDAAGRWVVYLPARAQAWLERKATAAGSLDRLRAAAALAWASHSLEYQGWRFRAALAKGQDSPWSARVEAQQHLQRMRNDPAAYMRSLLQSLDPDLQALPLARALAALSEPELATAVNALAEQPGLEAQARFFQACCQCLHRNEGNARERVLSYLLLSELGRSMPFMPMVELAQPQADPLWQAVPAALRQPVRIPQALLRVRGFKGLAGRVAVEIRGPFVVDQDVLKQGWRRLIKLARRGSA